MHRRLGESPPDRREEPLGAVQLTGRVRHADEEQSLPKAVAAQPTEALNAAFMLGPIPGVEHVLVEERVAPTLGHAEALFGHKFQVHKMPEVGRKRRPHALHRAPQPVERQRRPADVQAAKRSLDAAPGSERHTTHFLNVGFGGRVVHL